MLPRLAPLSLSHPHWPLHALARPGPLVLTLSSCPTWRLGPLGGGWHLQAGQVSSELRSPDGAQELTVWVLQPSMDICFPYIASPAEQTI